MRALRLCAAAAFLAAAPLDGQSHLVVIAGLGGEARYVDEFHAWGVSMVDAARDRFGLSPEQITYLAEQPGRDEQRIVGASTKENIERALRDLAARAGATDRVLILLIGHGSADDRDARINLPGPDITAAELARLLEAFPTQPIAIVNAASASGGFQDALAGRNRVVVTATRTGGERNETIFGRYFVAAFVEDGADADRNGRISVMEAFEYAVREVERSHRAANRLQMEHGRLEGDQELARAFHLVGQAPAPAADLPPELRALMEEKRRIEERIELLRLERTELGAERYAQELEQLLLELARTNREIRERGGAGR